MPGRRMTGRVAAIATVTVLGLGGVAAATTGALPGLADEQVIAGEGPTTTEDTSGEDTSGEDTSTTDPATSTPDTTEDTVEDTTTTTEAEPTTTETTEVPAPDGGPDPAGVGPDATGPARHGLCRAFGGRETMPEGSVAARNLAAAAAAEGMTVAEFCAATPAPGRSGEAPGHRRGGESPQGPPATTAPQEPDLAPGPPSGRGRSAQAPGRAGRG